MSLYQSLLNKSLRIKDLSDLVRHISWMRITLTVYPAVYSIISKKMTQKEEKKK